jgi:lipoate-protein ligase B
VDSLAYKKEGVEESIGLVRYATYIPYHKRVKSSKEGSGKLTGDRWEVRHQPTVSSQWRRFIPPSSSSVQATTTLSVGNDPTLSIVKEESQAGAEKMRIRAWNDHLRKCSRVSQWQPRKTPLPRFRFSSSLSEQSTSSTTASAPSVQVHSSLHLGCIDYAKSWAWQHVLLSRRLHQRRTEQPEDGDSVLFLEHHPVYTLGRGADENHLTFMMHDDDASSSEEQKFLIKEVQTKLSRKVRGLGTARLAVDRSVDDKSLAAMSLTDAVESLSHLASPVMAPNGVPIFRVERGGEVTFHGPSQLVVYPLLDLQRDPYKKDLHWYSRVVEEVVIQTLKHYDIESERDEENTGM